jgi:DNA-binding response OmpR family regulator
MVLLYEPDPDLAPLFCLLLEHLGCSVHAVTTLEEAARVAREKAVALAVVRPVDGDDGWARCQQLQISLGTPVIGLLTPETATTPAPGLHTLPQPVVPSALRQLVQQILTMVLI